ncbi:uroporphyrinogen-III synthase [Oikeobacillus pervagus]|uniref:Uroporphyrinogen-III synthase n=1 Tax=Oikeobacillus pervagus TaxID=1325931 RepID=A0AAJ1WK79_9BACI|nr:uroporphyrinogen-III synthase [Oikeobacillus pervagus]MDQ0216465.1 uroporphyrinogen-III synthase [Oikeobacillus pervagus]
MNSVQTLADKHILITRAKRQAKEFADKIEQLGGIPHTVSLIEFKPYLDPNKSLYVSEISSYDWIILTSINGVHAFFDELNKAGIQKDEIIAKFAVVGTKTNAVLKQYGFEAAFIPAKFTADDFVKAIEKGEFFAKKALIPKGNLARNIIAEKLKELGGTADEWIVYETYFPDEEKEHLLHLLQNEQLHMITFTSSSTVRHFMRVVKGLQLEQKLSGIVFACIGPVAKTTAISYGLSVEVCPEEYTIDGLLQEMCKYYEKEEQ